MCGAVNKYNNNNNNNRTVISLAKIWRHQGRNRNYNSGSSRL